MNIEPDDNGDDKGIIYNPPDWPIDAPQFIWSKDKKTKRNIAEMFKQDGRFWAKDKNHRKYLMRTHHKSGTKYFVHKKADGDGSFHPAMRFAHIPLPMKNLLEEKNEIEVFKFENVETGIEQNLFINVEDRTDQPGNVMGRWLGQDGVRAAYAAAKQETKNYKYISASIYAEESDWEWLHLRAHSLGGLDTSDNLVAGSKGANTLMLAIENALYEFSGLSDTTIRVDYTPESQRRWGQISRKAHLITYRVSYKGKEVFSRRILGAASSPMPLQYEFLKKEVLAKLQDAAGKKGVMVDFYKGNAGKFTYGYNGKFDV